MMRILTVIGARPQFIKAAAVSAEIARRGGVEEILVHTGQHFDANMSDVFFDELGIPHPVRNLGIAGGSHGAMTGRMLEALEAAMLEEAPDWVLVYGDTNSTVAGALAAAKLHIRIAHVEAGLRSFNKRMPEEINRILTDHCADLLFSPTPAATRNLAHEGIEGSKVLQVGDVMFDVARIFGARARCSAILEQNGLRSGAYVLATLHRQENTDDPARLMAIIEGLARVAETLPVVLPLHPRTRQKLIDIDASAQVARLRMFDPVGYLDMVALEKGAAAIATDSGGMQKEAYFHGVPCVTLRDETEWVELVEAGWNRLCPPTDKEAVSGAVLSAIGMSGRPIEVYGGGDASAKVLDALLSSGPKSS